MGSCRKQKLDTVPYAKPKQSATESLGNLEKAMSKELLDNYKLRSLTWLPKKRYELLWHKQITADTYSRILRRAYYSTTQWMEPDEAKVLPAD